MIISIGFSITIYQISYNELNRGLNRQTTILRTLPLFSPDQSPDFERIRLMQLSESNNNLRTNLIYFNLSILFFSAIACYFLAKRTLGPIEEAVEAQNRFTADASHELKTPLAAMKAEIEVTLRDKSLTLAKSKTILQSNLEEIQKLESLSKALLALSRFKTDANKNFKPVSIEDVICQSYERISKLADKKSIKFKNSLKNISVLGEEQSLIQLFTILLDNAIKYSPENSNIYISISDKKNYAVVKIKDSGCGIDPIDLPHIFDRFYRADASRCKVKTEGFGLGLSIANEIVNLHNGKISAQSKNKKGSEFTIKIPIAKL
jgi:two-component system, OmpR family, sensor histidine kinase CiaH